MQASAAEDISNAATAANTPRSSDWVSWSMDLMNCVVAALAASPSRSPISAGRSSIGEHPSQHLLSLSAERYADPDLARALRHNVRQHTEKARSGEQQ